MIDQTLSETASELRMQFDQSFAAPQSLDVEPRESLLAVRAGDRQLALRVAQIAAVRRCPEITPLPSHSETLLGIGAVHGKLLGIHSLAALVGGTRAPGAPRWIVVCDDAVALAFEELEGFARVPASDIRGSGDSTSATEFVSIGGERRESINLRTYLDSISARPARPTSKKE